VYKNKRILALIPARSGSKRLPGKNIKPIWGKPLIAWTIEEAKKSKYIDRIIVSTDTEEIAEISEKYGAEIPFLRPKELAGDRVTGTKVVLHAIEWMEKHDKTYDILMLLQPTSPLRAALDMHNAIKLLFERRVGAIVSVCELEHHPSWGTNTLSEGGCMKDFVKPGTDKTRQEFDKFYRINGAIYLAHIDYIKKQKSFFGNETFAYIMPQEKSVDIDSEMDFKLAEVLKQDEARIK